MTLPYLLNAPLTSSSCDLLWTATCPQNHVSYKPQKHPGSSFVFMLTWEWLPFLYMTWMCCVLSCMSFRRHVFNMLAYAYTFRSSISGSLKLRLINMWLRALPSSLPQGPSARTAPALLLMSHSSSFSFHQVLFTLFILATWPLQIFIPSSAWH